MKTIQKTLIAAVIVAVMAFSAAPNQAHALLTPGTLSISGSSTVYPVAVDASATFPSWYHTITGKTITLNIQAGGSGVAIPNMVANAYDMGEMSRPPTDAEWESMPNLQQWAIGIDSVAIVVNPYLSQWIQNLTVTQAADLFETFQNSSGRYPYYTYWSDFNPSAPDVLIQRAVRDPTSGTFDCFYNYFLKPAGFPQTETNASAEAQLASYTYCQNNIDVLNTINSTGGQYYIGFISLGYLHYGGLSAINIWNPATGTYVVPSIATVEDGTYKPWRWLWEVTSGPITANMSDPNFVEGLWISYLRLPNGYAPGVSFLAHEDYIPINPADMAGGQVINSTLQPETHLTATQTQTIPALGQVNEADILYFRQAYLQYYANNIYNPYADFNADGVINYTDIVAFCQAYIAANSP
jgi:ABC-type phosphate transport system substrate-binding protein